MSDRDFKRLYALTEGHDTDLEIIKVLVASLCNLSGMTRLLEIRFEELENSPQAKDLHDVIDGRDISALVDGKWIESK